jgi:hypothetical protein
MTRVFINYRNGDGEEAASALERELVHRFGEEQVFRAPRSIEPGAEFSAELSSAARTCDAFLAVIGENWVHDRRLHHESDWVRREILLALEAGALVVPILKGRATERLSITDLPAELADLAARQSLRYDPRGDGSDLARIGDYLASKIPELKQAEDRRAASGGAVSIRHNTGQVHMGSGDNRMYGAGSVVNEGTARDFGALGGGGR